MAKTEPDGLVKAGNVEARFKRRASFRESWIASFPSQPRSNVVSSLRVSAVAAQAEVSL